MGKEIELRVYDIDKEELIKKIEKLNGKFINNYEQIRYVYDFNPFKENKWIRLRTDGFKTTLTIKEYTSSKIDGVKELEIEVSDMEKTNLILEELNCWTAPKSSHGRMYNEKDVCRALCALACADDSERRIDFDYRAGAGNAGSMDRRN